MPPEILEVTTNSPAELLSRLRQLVDPDVPNRDPEVVDDEGDNGQMAFLVQLVLDRPYRNHIEAHALAYTLCDMDAHPAVMAVVMGNPLDGHSTSEVLHTFAAFSLHADSKEDAERLVTEAVTETVPAPFGIAAIVISAVARKEEGEN
jgi:hypothetical protein